MILSIFRFIDVNKTENPFDSEIDIFNRWVTKNNIVIDNEQDIKWILNFIKDLNGDLRGRKLIIEASKFDF